MCMYVCMHVKGPDKICDNDIKFYKAMSAKIHSKEIDFEYCTHFNK